MNANILIHAPKQRHAIMQYEMCFNAAPVMPCALTLMCVRSLKEAALQGLQKSLTCGVVTLKDAPVVGVPGRGEMLF